MITQPYRLYVERVAPDKNMARFYALAVQPTLFGEVSLCGSGDGSERVDSRWSISLTARAKL